MRKVISFICYVMGNANHGKDEDRNAAIDWVREQWSAGDMPERANQFSFSTWVRKKGLSLHLEAATIRLYREWKTWSDKRMMEARRRRGMEREVRLHRLAQATQRNRPTLPRLSSGKIHRPWDLN